MNFLEFIAVIFTIICLAGIWNNRQAANQARMEQERMLTMSREETKRWEILTGVIVNKPASRYPSPPYPAPARKTK